MKRKWIYFAIICIILTNIFPVILFSEGNIIAALSVLMAANVILIAVFSFFVFYLLKKKQEFKCAAKHHEKRCDTLSFLLVNEHTPGTLITALLRIEENLKDGWIEANAQGLFNKLTRKPGRDIEYIEDLFWQLVDKSNEQDEYWTMLNKLIDSILDDDTFLVANLLVNFYHNYSKLVIIGKKVPSTSCDVANKLLLNKIAPEKSKEFLEEMGKAVDDLSKGKRDNQHVIKMIELEIAKAELIIS